MHIEKNMHRKKDSHLRLFSGRREPPLLVNFKDYFFNGSLSVTSYLFRSSVNRVITYRAVNRLQVLNLHVWDKCKNNEKILGSFFVLLFEKKGGSDNQWAEMTLLIAPAHWKYHLMRAIATASTPTAASAITTLST